MIDIEELEMGKYVFTDRDWVTGIFKGCQVFRISDIVYGNYNKNGVCIKIVPMIPKLSIQEERKLISGLWDIGWFSLIADSIEKLIDKVVVEKL